MVEYVVSRMKLAVFVTLFLSPVAVSAWSKSLDRWLDSNHYFEAPSAENVVTDALTLVSPLD